MTIDLKSEFLRSNWTWRKALLILLVLKLKQRRCLEASDISGGVEEPLIMWVSESNLDVCTCSSRLSRPVLSVGINPYWAARPPACLPVAENAELVVMVSCVFLVPSHMREEKMLVCSVLLLLPDHAAQACASGRWGVHVSPCEPCAQTFGHGSDVLCICAAPI